MIVVVMLLPGVAQADFNATVAITQAIKTPARIKFDFLLSIGALFLSHNVSLLLFVPSEHRMVPYLFCEKPINSTWSFSPVLKKPSALQWWDIVPAAQAKRRGNVGPVRNFLDG